MPVDDKLSSASFLEPVREAEKEAVRSADDVFVIGWSMPETDLDQVSLINSCAGDREEPFKRLVVINYGQAAEYYRRIAKIFRVDVSSLEIHNDGFVAHVKREIGG